MNKYRFCHKKYLRKLYDLEIKTVPCERCHKEYPLLSYGLCLYCIRRAERYKKRHEKKVVFQFIWYDMWVGLYFSQDERVIYFCPFFCCVFKIKLRLKESQDER